MALPTPPSSSELDTKFLAIKIDQLDREVIRQPELFFQYSMKSNVARQTLDDAKNLAEITKAEVSAKIRARPEKYSITKVTESVISSAVLVHPLVVKTQTALREARFQSEVLQSAVTALDQKKRMLEVLVSLHGQNYFSSPSLSGNGKALMESELKKNRKAILPMGDAH